MIDPFDGPDLDVVRIMLITIDDPGGVGRSTTAQLLAKALDDRAIPVHMTTEPSRTALGEHIRAGTDTYRGMALACLVAGDRHLPVVHSYRERSQACPS